MIRVAPCSRSHVFSQIRIGRFSCLDTHSLVHKRFASHIPRKLKNHQEKTLSPLSKREVKVQNTPQARSDLDIEKLSEEIILKLEKKGLTVESGAFVGPVPDGLDHLLGWSKIKAERIRNNMIPEKRKVIEELAAKGDPLSQLRLDAILDYEKRFGKANTKNKFTPLMPESKTLHAIIPHRAPNK